MSLSPGLFANGREPLAEIHAHYDCEFESLSELSTFDAYLHLHANNNLECLLNRLDNSTMCASVEGRVPFTDHRLAEKIFTLPDHIRCSCSHRRQVIHYNQSSFELAGRGLLSTKRLLRAAFNKHVHPHILQRPKMSFPVPFIEWFQSHLKENFRSSLRESPLLNQILSQQAMQRDSLRPIPINSLRLGH